MSKPYETSVAPLVVDEVTFGVARDGRLRLRLFGELDACAVARVRECLVALDGDVELDCSGVSFIDAAGVGLFLQVHTECQARSAQLLIVNPSRCVLRLLELTGLDSILTVEPWRRAL